MASYKYTDNNFVFNKPYIPFQSSSRMKAMEVAPQTAAPRKTTRSLHIYIYSE